MISTRNIWLKDIKYLKFVNLTFLVFFLEKKTYLEKNVNIYFIYLHSLLKKWLFLQENKNIFVKIKPKIEEESRFKILIFQKVI